MASCKTYDQKPSVNGRGLSLGSMHGVIGLKFSSLINSDLTWKKIAKGNRTSSRRARNSVSRGWNAVEELIKTDSTTIDMPISDTEKLGVSVLGCRFSENTDHVPIKKRKLMFRSPAPPPRAAFERLKENKRPSKRQPEAIDCATTASDLGQNVDIEDDVSEKNFEVSKQLNEKEDFSGIHILAAAACRDSCGEVDHAEEVCGVEESYVHEDPLMENQLHPSSKKVVKEDLNSAKISIQGTGSCISAVLAEEPLLRTYSSSTEGILQGEKAHDKSAGDCSVAVSEDFLTNKVEGEDQEHQFSLQGDHSFWDLNTSTDTWSYSFDNHCINSNIADGIPDVNCSNYSDNVGSSESGTVQREPRGIRCHAEMKSLPADPGGIVCKEHISKTKELKLDEWTDIDRTSCSLEKFPSSEQFDFVSTEGDTSALDKDRSASTQSLSPFEVEGLTSRVHDSHPRESNQSLGTSISKAIFPAPSTAITCANNEDGCVGITCETVSSCLLVEEATYGTPDVFEEAKVAKENSLCQSELGLLPSSKHLEMLNLDVLPQDLKAQCENVFEYNKNDNVAHKGSEEPVTKSSEMSTAVSHTPYPIGGKDSMNSFNELPVEQPCDNGYDSDFSHDINACAKVSRFDTDYDSQYEDGEVRESMEYNWQEYDGEDIENKHVDYGPNVVNLDSGAKQNMTNTQEIDFQTCSSRFKGKYAKNVTNIIGIISGKSKIGVDMEISDGWTGIGKDDRIIGKRNDSGWRNIHRDDQTKVRESRTSRRESWSRVVEKAFDDVSFKKDRCRYAQHPHAKGQGGDCKFYLQDSRSIKYHRSLKDHGSMSSYHLRPSKVLDRPIRSRSPRDETLGMRMHYRSSRSLSPGWRLARRRGSSMRYGLQVEEGGPVSRYHGVLADDCSDSPMTHSQPLVRRDQSFSPFKRRGCHVHQSQTQYFPRSRSHSSSLGNPCFRWRSKSPNFRSAIRMQRTRSPNQRPGRLVDSGAGMVTRNHGSPPHTRRWIGDRKDCAVHFREQSYKQSSFLGRRSTRRFVQQADRVDLVDSPLCFRSMHSRRSMDMGEAGGEVLRYEESDDNRGRHRYRYGLAHPMKRYAIDRRAKQFHYNAADGYDSHYSEISDFSGTGSTKCRGRGIYRQIGEPRNFREDRRPFTYPREGKYNVDSKSFGLLQGGDNDMASRRRS